MKTKIAAMLLLAAIGLIAIPAWCQQPPTLAPPDNKYFLAKGSWGQNYPDQWGLLRIGFDASDQSAWRLVK